MRTITLPFKKSDEDYIYNLMVDKTAQAYQKGSAGRKSCVEEALEFYYKNRVIGQRVMWANTLLAKGSLAKSIKVKKAASEYNKAGKSLTQTFVLNMLPYGIINANKTAINFKSEIGIVDKLTEWVKTKKALGNSFAGFDVARKKKTRKVGKKAKYRRKKVEEERIIAGKIFGSWLSNGSRKKVFPDWYVLKRDFSGERADITSLKAIIAKRKCIEKSIKRGIK